MDQDFDKWNEIKKTINKVKIKKFLKEGEIWWANIGINVGSEQNGTGNRYERPVIIIKRFTRNTILVLPLTSKNKDRFYYYKITENNYIVLNQPKTIDVKRLTRQLKNIKISRKDYFEIMNEFIFIIKNRNHLH